MNSERLTIKEQVDFIFSKAIEKRVSFFVLVVNNAGLVITYYRNENGHITITPLEICMDIDHSLACIGYIRVNSGISPTMPRGIKNLQKDAEFIIGQIKQKILLTCIPSSVIGNEVLIVNLVQ